ncbi:iron-sulfur cluster carrier protein ApbC [Suttonella sp. R2A3]|uniref:iron-sulfur cluster carrier protein ApbC n=1 Tax=Suttonella sp. R2A3 TaxID=2908648 RepID=UPI001F35E024|nr:iron-sulfur cluster carrier protein ApbC [Suttonella sp. R2A3]UJF23880.1 iron-sulfur cluster carrier protein ApbC [Suttonella sp. R2A3]
MDAFIQAVSAYHDPVLDCHPFAHKGAVALNDGVLALNTLFPCALEVARYQQALNSLADEHGVSLNAVEITASISSHEVQGGLKPLRGVKNIIAVASGKGGVGKSTLTVNLAVALQQQGAEVGILDADIYGPSQAMLLGGAEKPHSSDGKSMEPVLRHGLQTMSIGDLIEEDTAMIWRGPMVTRTLIQLLQETRWKDLDYLIIDLPPGTGDTQLTLSQQIPVSGAVLITTPQDIALLDAKKGKAMFDKVSIPTLGLVENMSYYCCPQCGHEDAIFGEGGGRALAKQYEISLLGQIPLHSEIRAHSDDGTPIVSGEPEGELAGIYQRIAAKLTAELSTKRKNFTQAFPKIVVES